MSREPEAARIVDRLDVVARIMWQTDCGFVPVVDGANTCVGVVTDRDVCMASHFQGAAIAGIPVVAVMVQEPVTCRPDDSLAHAMDLLIEHQVHRLPVVDSQGVLLGVLSTSDVLELAAVRPDVVAADDALRLMSAVHEPRRGVRAFAEPAAEQQAAGAKVVPARGVAAKKAPAKEVAAKKTAAKKAAAKKAPAKKAPAKKPTATKKVAAKPAPKKAAPKKAAAKGKAAAVKRRAKA